MRQLSDANITAVIKEIVSPFTSINPALNFPVVVIHKHFLGEFAVTAFAFVSLLFKCDGKYQMVLLYVTEDMYDYSVIPLMRLDSKDIRTKILLFASQIELAEVQKSELAEGMCKEIHTAIVNGLKEDPLAFESLLDVGLKEV